MSAETLAAARLRSVMAGAPAAEVRGLAADRTVRWPAVTVTAVEGAGRDRTMVSSGSSPDD